MSRFNSSLFWGMLLLAGFWVGSTHAGNGVPPLEPNILEAKQLPPYCQAKFGYLKGGAARAWKAKIGKKNFLHMHHYCYALTDINRASKAFSNKRRRRFLLQRAIGNINYVLQRWDKRSPLYKKALSDKAMATNLLKY